MQKYEMQSDKLAGAKPTASTQGFLDIAEIKEETVVLKDGSLRAVIVVSSTNFSLKSSQEQESMISSYQSFLNSLTFPIQILMQSRRMDINSYLDKLRIVVQTQTNELLRLQTMEYIEYIGKLIEYASIMNKTFYIIVPLYVSPVKESVFSKLGSLFNPSAKVKTQTESFEKSKEELRTRTKQVLAGLGGMGLRTIILNTEELVELMYNSYNLSMSSPIHIKSVEDLELINPTK